MKKSIQQILEEERAKTKLSTLTDGYINSAISRKIRWDSMSPEERKEFGKKSQKALEDAGYKIPKKLFDEIYYHEDMWGPDRGTPIYKKLALEYNLPLNTVYYIAQGGDNIEKDTRNHNARMEEWKSKYQLKFQAISPGVDRLSFYDKHNFPNSNFPPSLHYTAFKEHWSQSKIQEEISKLGLGDCYFNTGRFRNRFSWLEDLESKVYDFDSIHDFLDWFQLTFDKPKMLKQTLYSLCEYPVSWQTPYTGWSFRKLK
jgi:hypothetical protein